MAGRARLNGSLAIEWAWDGGEAVAAPRNVSVPLVRHGGGAGAGQRAECVVSLGAVDGSATAVRDERGLVRAGFVGCPPGDAGTYACAPCGAGAFSLAGDDGGLPRACAACAAGWFQPLPVCVCACVRARQ